MSFYDDESKSCIIMCVPDQADSLQNHALAPTTMKMKRWKIWWEGRQKRHRM